MHEDVDEQLSQLEEILERLKEEEKDLRAKIEARKVMAEEMQIKYKVSAICHELGERKAEALFKFKDLDFEITWDDNGHNGKIFYQAELVFESRLGFVEFFIPGDWLQKFETLYKRAKIRFVERQVSKLREKINSLKHLWKIK